MATLIEIAREMDRACVCNTLMITQKSQSSRMFYRDDARKQLQRHDGRSTVIAEQHCKVCLRVRVNILFVVDGKEAFTVRGRE